MRMLKDDSDARGALLDEKVDLSSDDPPDFLETGRPSRWETARIYWRKSIVLDPNTRVLSSKASTVIFSSKAGSTILSFITRFLYALVPQLLRTIYFNDPAPATRIHSTSWMNGIRGIAAVCVFNQHFFNAFSGTIMTGFGAKSGNKWIHQLPIFELFADGMCAVMVFFTVSGYVCGSKPLQAITDGDGAALFKSLPASVFRRWFRLYLPAICSTISICIFAYIGAYEPTRFLVDQIGNDKIFPGPAHGRSPPRFATISHQIEYWWANVCIIVNFWTEFPNMPAIDRHLWTIVREFRGSMHLYIVLIALAACKTWARISLLIFLGYVYTAWSSQWVPTAFFYGALLAQLDILRTRKAKEQQQRDPLYKVDDDVEKDNVDPLLSPGVDIEAATPKPGPSLSRLFRKIGLLLRRRGQSYDLDSYRLTMFFRVFLYAVALYLMSFPHFGMKEPSLLYENIVNPLIPSFYGKGSGPNFPKQTGVLLLMYLLSSVPPQQRVKSLWHRLLTCGFVQYLGSIMFGLYLIHGSLQHMIGFALPHFIWRKWSVENNTWEYGVPDDNGEFLKGLLIGWLATLVLGLWVADVWTREIEGRCTKVTRWLEELLFAKK